MFIGNMHAQRGGKSFSFEPFSSPAAIAMAASATGNLTYVIDFREAPDFGNVLRSVKAAETEALKMALGSQEIALGNMERTKRRMIAQF